MCHYRELCARVAVSHLIRNKSRGRKAFDRVWRANWVSSALSLITWLFALSLHAVQHPPPHIRVLSPAHISFWVSALQKSLTWCQVTLSIRHNACATHNSVLHSHRVRTIKYIIHIPPSQCPRCWCLSLRHDIYSHSTLRIKYAPLNQALVAAAQA